MTVSGEQKDQHRPFRTWCYALLLGGSAVLIAVHATVDSKLWSFLTLATILVGTVAMISIGLRAYRPARPLPWYLLCASAVLSGAGAGLRNASEHGLHPLDDVCTLLAYLAVGLAALIWLRPRQVRSNYDLLLDSGLIGLGALLASWTFLISPILHNHDTTVNTIVAATYPVLDALLLTLISHSMATSTRSESSLRFVHVGLIAALLGDLGYSLDTAGAATIGREVMMIPLLAAYAIVGVSALHPTMTGLGAPRRIHPHQSRQRASFIAVALIVASLVPVVGSSLGTVDRVVVSSLFALLLIGVLVRSERAIVRSSRSERRAQYQADHDMLTGLLNRSALLRALNLNSERWAEQPLCLLFIDLDGFKMVNDSYGHAVGDELIANAASRIRRVVLRDDVVARYGGDEFVVLSPLDRQAAATLAERLLGAFVRPFELSAGEIPITASIGIACGSPRSTESTVYDLIRDADSAMYHAKEYSLGYAFHDDARHAPDSVRHMANDPARHGANESGRRIWRASPRSTSTAV